MTDKMQQLHTDKEDGDVLFQPLAIRGTIIRNRVAVAPMTRVSATADGRVTERMARYYSRFARGGFGLIITEGLYIDTEHSQGYLQQPGLATPGHEQSWHAAVDAVHAEGGKIFAQLMHAGAQAQGNTYVRGTVGPSVSAPRGQQLVMYRGRGPYPVPRALDKSEMARIRRAFAAAARRAVGAGFDGVEIHGANGYLLDEFLTDYMNQRDDEYGGSMAKRVRYAVEVCDAVMQEVGDDLCVGLRISQAKVSDAEHRWSGGTADAQTVFGALHRSGIHFLHTTEYRATSPAFPNGRETLAQLARRHTGLPVIANGQLDDPVTARGVLSTGSADLIALGKAALANPDWPRRVQAGRDVIMELPPRLLGPLADIKDEELRLHPNL